MSHTVPLLLYRVVLYLVSPVFIARFLWRCWRNPDYKNRALERIGYSGISAQAGRIWIHAVSVGEVNAAVPLVHALQKRWPGKQVVITTMTTTGNDRVSQVFADKVLHCYLPYDYPGAVRRFLSRVTPELAIVMETEIWPNLIYACDKRKIPMVYTNVRLSERSFKGYQKVRTLFAPLLATVRCFAVQGSADASRLQLLGAPADVIRVTGSLKFDMQMPASVVEAGQSIRRQIGQHRQVIVAASTHDGEEEMLVEVFIRLKEKIAGLLLILVPRHPERFDSVYRLCQKRGLNVVRRSQGNTAIAADTDTILVDQMGWLPQFISAGDVTFMGGSLVATGGHNLLEPAALGRAVVFGPHMFNFAEISQLFLKLGAGIQIQHADELDAVMVKLFDDASTRNKYASAGEKLVQENKGALTRVIEIIEEIYPPQTAG